MGSIVNSAIRLSKKTFAALLEDSESGDLDNIRGNFVEFCKQNHTRYRSWKEAWKSFVLGLPVLDVDEPDNH